MPTTSACVRLGVVALLLAFAAGCSGENWVINEQVEGTVKLDGKPLANVAVEFVPTGDPKKQPPLSHGTTDDKGHFVLTCDNKKPGAVVGKHSVLVIVGRSEGDKQPDPIPAVYANLNKTPLKLEITPDKHTYDLDLTAKAGTEKK